MEDSCQDLRTVCRGGGAVVGGGMEDGGGIADFVTHTTLLIPCSSFLISRSSFLIPCLPAAGREPLVLDPGQPRLAAWHVWRRSPCTSERRCRQGGSDRVSNRSGKSDGPLRLRPFNVVPVFGVPGLNGVTVERKHVVKLYTKVQVCGHLMHQEPEVVGPRNPQRMSCQQCLEVLLGTLLGMIADEVVRAVLPQREAMLGQNEVLLGLLHPATDQGDSVFSFARREPCLPSVPRGQRSLPGSDCGPHPPVSPR